MLLWHRAVIFLPSSPLPLPSSPPPGLTGDCPPCSLSPAEREGDVHINNKVFNYCYHKIRDWLNIPAMQGHLMKYGLLVTPQDMHYVGKDIPPWEKVEYVRSKAHGMKDGYHLLYLSIYESQDQHMGHKDAAEELEEYGECWRICVDTLLHVHCMSSPCMYMYIRLSVCECMCVHTHVENKHPSTVLHSQGAGQSHCHLLPLLLCLWHHFLCSLHHLLLLRPLLRLLPPSPPTADTHLSFP